MCDSIGELESVQKRAARFVAGKYNSYYETAFLDNKNENTSRKERQYTHTIIQSSKRESQFTNR